MKYYQLSFTLDKSVRGKFEMPHTISIESPNFLKYISEKSKNITMYFENRMDLYENMPDNLIGKLLKRKNVIDFMDFTPACLSLIAVVSNKIKRILEHLDVSRNEYVLKRITVKDFSDDFYLLFLPIIPDTEFVYPRCVFEDMYDSGISKVFNNRTEYYSDPNYYYLKRVALKKKYKSYYLLYPQGGDFFFSERIIDAMQKENIVGYDIIKGGCFYEEIRLQLH